MSNPDLRERHFQSLPAIFSLATAGHNFRMALPWDFSSDHCPVVYHYTSIEAARAIVENRTFRLSEYTALNDASEFSYARDRLIGLMRDRQVYTDLTTRIFVVSELEGLTANTGLMIGSLTPRRDDLGQWRSYAGDGGGCVLGLDARHLEHDAGVAIRTVVYDEALVDRMLCLGLGVVQQPLEDDPDDHPTLSDYARRLCVDLFSMKHPGFADEREVRISRMLVRNGDGALEDVGGNRTGGEKTPALPVGLRAGRFGPTRYVDVPLARQDGSSAIVSVGMGPTMSADAAPEASDFFQSHGLEIWRSSLPYRA